MIKRFLLWLVFPTDKAIARWESQRRRGLIRFILVFGAQWLVMFLALVILIDVVWPLGITHAMVSALEKTPFYFILTLIIVGLGVGSSMGLSNEAAYRVLLRGRGHEL